jgi:hypothetical protein
VIVGLGRPDALRILLRRLRPDSILPTSPARGQFRAAPLRSIDIMTFKVNY